MHVAEWHKSLSYGWDPRPRPLIRPLRCQNRCWSWSRSQIGVTCEVTTLCGLEHVHSLTISVWKYAMATAKVNCRVPYFLVSWGILTSVFLGFFGTKRYKGTFKDRASHKQEQRFPGNSLRSLIWKKSRAKNIITGNFNLQKSQVGTRSTQ